MAETRQVGSASVARQARAPGPEGQAGDDPDQVRRALAETFRYQGVTGSISYRGTGGDPDKRLFITRVEDGAAVLYRALEAPAGAPAP